MRGVYVGRREGRVTQKQDTVVLCTGDEQEKRVPWSPWMSIAGKQVSEHARA